MATKPCRDLRRGRRCLRLLGREWCCSCRARRRPSHEQPQRLWAACSVEAAKHARDRCAQWRRARGTQGNGAPSFEAVDGDLHGRMCAGQLLGGMQASGTVRPEVTAVKRAQSIYDSFNTLVEFIVPGGESSGARSARRRIAMRRSSVPSDGSARRASAVPNHHHHRPPHKVLQTPVPTPPVQSTAPQGTSHPN